MAYFNFVSQLSSVMSEKLIAVLPSQQLKPVEISVNSLKGDFKTSVEDKCFAIPKERFFAIASPLLPSQEDNSLLDRVWKEFDTGQGKGFIELKINDCMRQSGILSDIQFFTKSDFLVFNMRMSAQLPTQQPTSYKPLFYGPFDNIVELIQGQYALTCSEDIKPILASWHFASCVGFAAFNAEKHIGILAHIDASSHLGFFKEHIRKCCNTTTLLTFRYVLIGDLMKGKKKEFVQQEIESLNTNTLNFVHVESYGAPFSEEDLNQDSSWIASVRLSRSIALDTTQNSLEAALMSYEPYLNYKSSLQGRNHTLQEADDFALKRGNGSFTCVYNSANIMLSDIQSSSTQ